MNFKNLNLPAYPFKIKKDKDGEKIFDEIRKKYLVLTPEEWVRQNFIQYLVGHLGYPAGLMAIESGLKVHSMDKRSDLLIYDSAGNKCMLVECKAPDVELNQKVFDQAARYNLVYKAPYIIITNGIMHYCVHVKFETGQFEFLNEIPVYSEIR